MNKAKPATKNRQRGRIGLLALGFVLATTFATWAHKKYGPAEYMPQAGDIVFQAFPSNPLTIEPYEATIRRFEGGPPPLAREMLTPVSLARDPRLSRVFLSGFAATLDH